MPHQKRLEGKRALITGASKGLGRQIALDYAKEGAAGLSLVSRNKGPLKAVQDEILKVAPEIDLVTISADVGNEEDAERLAAVSLNEFRGRLDVLVNNASTIGPTPMPFLLDYPATEFRRVLETNLIGPFVLIKKLLPAMLMHGGSIINVTSDAGTTGYAGWGAYGVSKFGLEGLSQTWAAELQGTHVRLNVVDPGNMNTEMHRAAEPTEDPAQWADPADVTEVFIYLASDESKGVNGRRFEAQSFHTPKQRVVVLKRRKR